MAAAWKKNKSSRDEVSPPVPAGPIWNYIPPGRQAGFGDRVLTSSCAQLHLVYPFAAPYGAQPMSDGLRGAAKLKDNYCKKLVVDACRLEWKLMSIASKLFHGTIPRLRYTVPYTVHR